MTPLLLLPGLLCDDAVWRAPRALLATPVDCVVPAYGELDSLAAMAEHVLAVAPAPRFSLAGHSMGGRVALEVLRRAPERVERLCLMDSGVDPLAAGEAGQGERDKRMALLDLARTKGMRAMGRQWARGMVHPSRLDTPLFDEVLDMIERKTPAVFAAQIEALLGRPDAAGVLRAARCPTLILCGRQDAWSPPARHEAMHALLPGSQLVFIEEAGHMAPMEQPAAVAAALDAWLGAVRAGA